MVASRCQNTRVFVQQHNGIEGNDKNMMIAKDNKAWFVGNWPVCLQRDLRVIEMTINRPKSLGRLMVSLRSAHYHSNIPWRCGYYPEYTGNCWSEPWSGAWYCNAQQTEEIWVDIRHVWDSVIAPTHGEIRAVDSAGWWDGAAKIASQQIHTHLVRKHYPPQ